MTFEFVIPKQLNLKLTSVTFPILRDIFAIFLALEHKKVKYSISKDDSPQYSLRIGKSGNLTTLKSVSAILGYILEISTCNPQAESLSDLILRKSSNTVNAKEIDHSIFPLSSAAAVSKDQVAYFLLVGCYETFNFLFGADHVVREGAELFPNWVRDHVSCDEEFTPVLENVKKTVQNLYPVMTTSSLVDSTTADPSKVKVNPECVYKDKSNGEVLPKDGEENILITSALPYVNNVPHLGNIIGCVLSGDVFARYCRLKGYNTLYICGTDEYGTATETKALEEGVSCKELCDKYSKLHAEIYDWFNISFDHFGRTSTPAQTEITQDIFKKLHDNDYTTEEAVSQLYCEKCSRFLADRYVEGTCPLCGFGDARGDQCDACQKLLNAVDLKNPRCKLDGNSPIIKESRHIFIKLPELEKDCAEFVERSSVTGKWTSNSIAVTKAWLKEGLKNRCITRDLKWGTPVPLESMKEKVFYVWFDAPIGYLSITANYTKEWEKWWKNPDNVKLYQFMGKDNIPFHTVIFPCSLLGTREPYTMLHHLSTTDYLNYESGKFSKSRKCGVFGNNVMETGIPSSVWRYYLLANRPESTDSVFLWDDFVAKTNSELLANLGNLVSRTTKFCKAKFNSVLPSITITDLEKSFTEKINVLLQEYNEALSNVKLKAGLKAAMAISSLGNAYLSDAKLDNNLFTNENERCSTVINYSLNIVYTLTALLSPFIPEATEEILKQLNAPIRLIPSEFGLDLLPGHVIGTPSHLFKRIEEAQAKALREKYSGKQVA